MFRIETISLHYQNEFNPLICVIMQVFKLEIDCAKCYWVGMALVAAMSYDAAVAEYVKESDSGEFVENGEIIFTSDSKEPLDGLTSANTGILCEVVCFDA